MLFAVAAAGLFVAVCAAAQILVNTGAVGKMGVVVGGGAAIQLATAELPQPGQNLLVHVAELHAAVGADEGVAHDLIWWKTCGLIWWKTCGLVWWKSCGLVC